MTEKNLSCRLLADLVDEGKAELQTGPFGTMLHASAYTEFGTPVVAVKNIGKNRLVHDAIPRIDDETKERLSRYSLKEGDILFSRKGAVERRALVRQDEEGWIQGSDCIRLRFFDEEIDSTFISYLLGTSKYQNWLIHHSIGATMPSLNQSILSLLPIPIFPISVQRRIAHILGTLDDKIELNRRVNATLEAMARALFRSWFVDFDPVRAKVEGRQPAGMDEATAALFPDEFEASELGEIPMGWRSGKLSEIITMIGGGTPSTTVDEYWNGEIPWFSVVDAPRESDVFVLNTEKSITEPGLNNCSTRLLPPGTTIVTARGTVGKLALTGVPMTMNQSCYAIRGQGTGSDFYTYFLLKSQIGQLQQQTHGSVFDTITRATFDSLDIVIPPETLISHFESMIASIMGKIKSNCIESRSLVVLRDALLPHLLSGELPMTATVTPTDDT